jgi:cellulose synthase/poly-beta-1,6-N-acetylglucosamine synthase-like glycosyltransferase
VIAVGSLLLAAWCAVALVLVPACGVLWIECFAALLHRRRAKRELRDGAVTSVVLVPAHNEEASLPQTLASIQPQLTPRDRVLVVADNCTDRTAELAREAGAEVIERHDPVQRGKGFALACGIEQLGAQPPDVLIVVDADTQVLPGTLAALSQAVARTGRPSQAVNLLSPPASPSSRDLISAFAFRVRNLVRPLGQSVLGVPCQLMGNGMAIPWASLAKINLASANIVEDLQLGIDLAVAGYVPAFNLEGRVAGVLPASARAAQAQRRRWEHGHLATMLGQVPRLLAAAVRQRRGDLLWLALDTAVPPLALVVVLWGLAALLGLAVGSTLQVWWPTWTAAALALMLGSAIAVAWMRFASDIPGRAMFMVPAYVLRKVPMYAMFLWQRQQQWVRTDRAPSARQP